MAQKRCEMVDIEEFLIKTHKNLIFSCSTYLAGFYDLHYKFGGVKKGVKTPKKGVKWLI